MIPGQPSTLIGIPFDRPVVGYGGKTINTLRLWAAAAPDYFDFQEFGTGDFVGALAETLEAESLTRVLVSRRLHNRRAGAAFHAGVFSGRLFAGRSDPPLSAPQHGLGTSFPRKAAIQLNDTHPSMAVRGADAHPAGRCAPRMGPGLGSDQKDFGLHEPHVAARGAREMAGGMV